MTKGLVMVYTGNGKGKTTAALGLALRAVGHGKKVLMIQFMKGDKNYGEIKAVERYLPGFKIIQSGLDTFVNKNNPSKEDIYLAQEGYNIALKEIKSAKYDMIILDEVNVAVEYNLLSLDQIIDLIKEKPDNLDLVLTGRYAPYKVIDIADMVSEIKEIKHHYSKGIKAKEGVEF